MLLRWTTRTFLSTKSFVCDPNSKIRALRLPSPAQQACTNLLCSVIKLHMSSCHTLSLSVVLVVYSCVPVCVSSPSPQKRRLLTRWADESHREVMEPLLRRASQSAAHQNTFHSHTHAHTHIHLPNTLASGVLWQLASETIWVTIQMKVLFVWALERGESTQRFFSNMQTALHGESVEKCA